jgi:predicted transposase YbfD/YdcC
VETAVEVGKGHGRLERRAIEVTDNVKGYVDWPGLERVFRLTRERTVRGEKSVEVVHGVTSLSRAEADAAELIAINRGHWAIENSLFHVRDCTFGEDQCRVRKGTGPEALAWVRNAAISLIRRAGHTNVKAATEQMADDRPQALALLLYGRTE